jgi:5-methylcytosine-specific restriction endonuclease McrA
MPKPRASDPYHDKRWKGLRLRILARDLGVCQRRGVGCRGTATTVDHIEPIGRGGAWFDEANLRAACTTCNYGRRPPTPVDRGSDPTPSRDW